MALAHIWFWDINYKLIVCSVAGEDITHGGWMVSIENNIICEGIKQSFITGLAAVFPTYYVFKLEYQDEAARTLLSSFKSKSSARSDVCCPSYQISSGMLSCVKFVFFFFIITVTCLITTAETEI